MRRLSTWVLAASLLLGCPADEKDWVIPVAPPDWNPQKARTPRLVHMTYQRDPGGAVTMQWRTTHDDADYVPRVWVAPAALTALLG